ncbi:MAG: septation protein A [Nitratireductor sp.]|nr:septation protein A [Nitratireductor sp.]
MTQANEPAGRPNTDKPTGQQVSPVLKLVLELGPLVVFFMANRYGEALASEFPVLQALGGKIFIGTAFFMVAMTISIVLSHLWMRHVAMMPLVTFVFVLLFGGLTLWLQDETFIKMKPTIVNVIFGGILLAGLFFGKSLLAYVFGAAFQLDAEGWRKLTLRWGLFFFVLAALNEIVWRNFSDDFWITFKIWGIMPLTFAFMLAQFPLLQRHALEAESE